MSHARSRSTTMGATCLRGIRIGVLLAFLGCIADSALPCAGSVSRMQWPSVGGLAKQQRHWPPGTSDLPADSDISFGQLDNGLRIAWQQCNRAQTGSCSLRLVVHAGSLDEQDSEQGMAHFVEHMAFNGTRRFPGNAINDWLASRGMQFGPHVNAFTLPTATIYRIDLPNSDPATLQDGLDVLRQFASEVLFDPHEIENERGVIDAEELELSSPETRVRQELFTRLAAGTRTAKRLPLGTAAHRASFSVEDLRAFYARWYRADNMTLVLVGNLEDVEVNKLCENTFDSLRRPEELLTKRANLGRPTLTDRVFAIEQPNRDDVSCFVQAPIARKTVPTTAKQLRRDVLRDATCEMTRWILADALTKDKGPVRNLHVAQPSVFGFGNAIDSMAVVFRCNPVELAAALGACRSTIADIIEGGFPPTLLGRVRQKKLVEIERASDNEASAGSKEIADRIAWALGVSDVPASPTFLNELKRRTWRELDTEACDREFRSCWIRPALSIISIGPPSHEIDLAAAWSQGEAESKPTPSREANEEGRQGHTAEDPSRTTGWPYKADAEGSPEPIERKHDRELDVEDVRFANGVRLIIKRRGRTPNQILYSVSIGGGASLLNADARPAAIVYEAMFSETGLRQLERDELHKLSFAQRAQVEMQTHARRFELRGSTNRASQEFQLERLHAHYTEPNFDSTVLSQAAADWVARTRREQDSSAGVLWRYLDRLAGQRLVVGPADVEAIKIDDVKVFFESHIRSKPVTIVAVGDLDVEETVGLVARTFGRLPPRRRPEQLAETIPYRETIEGVREDHDLDSHERSSAVRVFVPLAEVDDSAKTPAWQLLVRVLQDRLLARIREALGATYAPIVADYDLPTPLRSTVLWIQLTVAPDTETAVLAAVLQEMEALRTEGATATELEGARNQLLHQLAQDRATNGHWLTELSRAHHRPGALSALRDLDAGLQSVTLDDLAEVAGHALATKRLSTLAIRAHPK